MVGRFVGCAVIALIAAGALVTIGGWAAGTVLGMSHPSGPGRFPAALILIVVVGVVVFSVRRLRPAARSVRGLVEGAAKIESGDYSRRVPEQGPRELRALARAFNSMSARLEADATRRRGALADVTHELRTPLAVIRAQTEAIADGVHPADAEHLAPILHATRHLEGLLEDLRTLALADAGALTMAEEAIDARGLIHEAVATMRAPAEAASVAIEEGAEADLPEFRGDPVRLLAVLNNLAANAIRHTPAGGRVRLSARPGAAGGVTIEVADSGEGIPPDLLPTVFERFVRGPGSTGTGLGLAIARDVVQAHGGTIAISSRPGAGTTVVIDIPAGGLGSGG